MIADDHQRKHIAIDWILRALIVIAAIGAFVFGSNVVATYNVPLDSVIHRAPDEKVLVAQERLSGPSGYAVTVFAQGLGPARVMRWIDSGDLLVVIMTGDLLLVEADRDGDGKSDGSRVLMTGLDNPHGIEVFDGHLYVAEAPGIFKQKFDAMTGELSGSRIDVITDYPGTGGHSRHRLRYHDGYMYFHVGSTCNVCIEEHPWQAAILRFDPKQSDPSVEIFATGLRNTMGFDWHPVTGELYGVDNGRDLAGDDYPACELNLIEEGNYYGWPTANGFSVLDPDLGSHDPGNSTPMALGFAAHSAPLSIEFLSRDIPGFKDVAFVGLHGSWNRKTRQGYMVMSLHWLPDGRIEQRPFLTGFVEPVQRARDMNRNLEVFGRPVDVTQGPDDAIYVSDDYGGAIWRVAPDAAHLGDVGTAPSEPDLVKGARAVAARDCLGCHRPNAKATPFSNINPLSLSARRITKQLMEDEDHINRWFEGEVDAIATYLSTRY